MNTEAAVNPPKLHAKPWTIRARASRAVRTHLDTQDRVTPHFSWTEFACHDPERSPVPPELRANTIRLCWLLEKLRHELGDISLNIESGYRTPAWNVHVGGAADSRHTHADAADFTSTEIARWIAVGTAKNRDEVLAIANRIFANGAVGNETSGTLHVDARGFRVRFVTWVAAT
jgi:peptidase M15-like protein